MSEYMLSATLALNDMIRMGVTQDWATHMIGHELTALHGLTHGATLAIVINGTLRVLRDQKHGKLLQFGERIWGITGGSDEERIDRTLVRTEEFFRSLGTLDAPLGGGDRAWRQLPRSSAGSMLRASTTVRPGTSTERWPAASSRPASDTSCS